MNDWKKELKSRFDDYQIGEPDGLWDSIEKSLPGKGRKVIPFWWIAGPAIAVAAALAVFVVPRGRKAGNIAEPIAVVEVAPSSNDNDEIIPDNSFITEVSPINKAIAEVLPTKKVEIVNSIPSEQISTLSDDTQKESEEKEEFIPTEVPSKETRQSRQLGTEQTEYKPIDILPNPSNKKRQGLSYKISTSASSSSSSTSTGYGYSILNTKSDISSSSLHKINNLLTANHETEKTVNHRMPARLSFDIIYKITERIGIGTGLSRTSLSSSIHSGTSTVYTNSEQKMVLVGIPLSLYYEIPLSGGRFGLYASVGGMWEKAVDYSLDSREYIGGVENSTHSYSGSMPDYSQWSVNAVAGGHVRISKNSGWSVFAEAGATRHFDNGSDISTIYNDKPLMPLVNFGLRYSINN